MIAKYKQKLFGYGKGDCWRTCIACLTNMEPETIPNFCEHDDWFEQSVAWLKTQGFGCLYTTERGHMLNCYAIATGRSPRWPRMAELHPDVDPSKFLHSVIVRLGDYGDSDEWIHDPHPENTFLDLNAEPIRDWMILVPLP